MNQGENKMTKRLRKTDIRALFTVLGPAVAMLCGQQPVNAAPPALHTVGNKVVNAKGKIVRLQGVNVPSLDWDPAGEHVLESIDVAFTQWNANIVRIPLTQDIWFGYFKGQKSAATAAAYQKLVDAIVSRVSASNKYVLLDLHWSDGGVWGMHVGQHAMPDDNSIQFWKSVAKRYANNPAVLFDLYNEPHDVSWDVWKNGGAVEERNDDPARGKHLQYHSPGMQALVDTVRATGAKNIVIAGGLDWAYDLRGIVAGNALTERGGNGIMYATHIYPWKKDWDLNVTPATTKYPVFVGEVGTKPWHEGDPPHENVYTESWAPDVLKYIEKHGLSWTAWSLHPSANPCLITGWDYKPTDYWGRYVKAALATRKN